MEGRFEVRREELLALAQVSVEDWDGVTERLEAFVQPFVAALNETAQQQQQQQQRQRRQRRHFVESASGLLSNLERKTGEGIAYRHGQDRQPMPQFVGESPWEHAPLLTELARQVGARIGAVDRRSGWRDRVRPPVCSIQDGPSRSRGRSRWVSRGSGADGRARSTTVRGGSTWPSSLLKISCRVGQARFERRPTIKSRGVSWWAGASKRRWSHPTPLFQQAATCRVVNTRWSTCGGICPRSGRSTARGAARRESRTT